MVETTAAVAELPRILQVDDLDAIFIGPSDLALGAGMPIRAQDGDPAYDELLQSIIQPCRERGLPVGIYCASPAHLLRFRAMGCTFGALMAEASMLRDAAAAHLAASPLSPAAGSKVRGPELRGPSCAARAARLELRGSSCGPPWGDRRSGTRSRARSGSRSPDDDQGRGHPTAAGERPRHAGRRASSSGACRRAQGESPLCSSAAAAMNSAQVPPGPPGHLVGPGPGLADHRRDEDRAALVLLDPARRGAVGEVGQRQPERGRRQPELVMQPPADGQFEGLVRRRVPAAGVGQHAGGRCACPEPDG